MNYYQNYRLSKLITAVQSIETKQVDKDYVLKNATLENIAKSDAATNRILNWVKEKKEKPMMVESKKKYDYEKVKQATKLFLEGIGEDVNREGLLETPDRVAEMQEVMFGGYSIDNREHVKLFEAESDDMVTLSNINFVSYCEHHLQPFIGKFHVAYIPNKHIVGISKLVRIARTHCKKLQNQERLTKNIADDIEKLLEPKGVAVQMRSQHFCMCLRGVRSQGSVMTTTAVRGLIKEDAKARTEFLDAIKGDNNVFGY